MRRGVLTGPSLALVFFLFANAGEAQVSVAWAATYRGPALSDNSNQARGISVDRFGNVFVTGTSSGTAPITYNYGTVKYNSNGDSIWARRYEGDNNVGAADVLVDHNGNVYVTGDPVTIKYDSFGNELWVRRNPNRYAGFGSAGKQIRISDSGYVYVSGRGVGLGGNPDIITWKLDTAGNMLWMAQYDGQDHDADRLYDMALDPSGNVIVVGETFIIRQQSGYDYITIKYAPNGDTLWTRRYDVGVGGWNSARGISTDSAGNIYVTGWSDSTGTGSDALTIKYDPNGNILWTARYNSPTNGGDTGDDIVVDRFGNVYVTGISQSINYAVHKYDNNGVHQWTQIYQGGGSFFSIIVPRISLDTSGNIYATVRVPDGQFDSDFGVVKYSPNGNRVWLATYPRPGATEVPNAMAVDQRGNVYLTGYLGRTSVDFDYLTVKFTQGPVSVDDQEPTVPASLMLHQNYPNPFNPSTTISYQLPTQSYVTLKVFDVLGREVATLVDDRLNAGEYSVVWNAGDAASGVYMYQLRVDGTVMSKRMLLIK